MVDDRLTASSSAFDEALARNRQELDELLSKSQSSLDAPRSSRDQQVGRPRATRVESSAQPAIAVPSTELGSRRFDEQASAVVRRLNERLGSGWRYDIVENIRDADEIIVRCVVTIPVSGVRKAQFGSARIAAAGAPEVTGAADGVSFSLQLGDPGAPQSSQDTEQAAFQQAVETALGRCEEML